MDLKIVASVLLLAAIATGIGLLLPTDGGTGQTPYFPWQIGSDDSGNSTVFGLTLGHSRLGDAERNFNTTAEVSLFAAKDTAYVVEAYFDKLVLAGLSAKMTMVISVPGEQLHAMYARGSRISTLGSGTHKVSLHPQDRQLIKDAVISSITYLPAVRLTPDVIEKRFGVAVQKIREADNNVTHWLYPQQGLDISFGPDSGAVLQYVAPAQFSLISAPLFQSK